jgi:hypothetical protein
MATSKGKPPKSQLDKFHEAAREVETDDREEAFDEKLKRVARVEKGDSPPREKKPR